MWDKRQTAIFLDTAECTELVTVSVLWVPTGYSSSFSVTHQELYSRHSIWFPCITLGSVHSIPWTCCGTDGQVMGQILKQLSGQTLSLWSWLLLFVKLYQWLQLYLLGQEHEWRGRLFEIWLWGHWNKTVLITTLSVRVCCQIQKIRALSCRTNFALHSPVGASL